MLGGLAVSAAMAVQDQCGGSRSNSILPAGNGVSVNAGLHVVTGSRLNEQFSCGNDFSPKVRKPYTITKQRERWTEEEHKKFLEALKLYGRAWRRIEEHVGSKTAVQIRSHAQKFFSKVVRESSGSGTTTSPEEPIEIPPPRPKRKPIHPYPRKMVHPLNKEVSTSEQLQRSPSPNLSISDHDNQSPTSVLSVIYSDALGSTDSNTPNRSLSPASCAWGSHSADSTISEPNLTPEDDMSRSAAMITDADAANDERSPKVQKLTLFLKDDVSEDGVAKETSTRSLKLFGRMVLITECHGDGPAFETIGSPKLLASSTKVQVAPCNLNATDLLPGNGKCTWGQLPQASGGLYYSQFQKENSNSAESGSAAATAHPWWVNCGGLPFALGTFPKPETVKVILDSNEEFHEKEIQKEGSWTGSNSGSLNGGENVDKNMDIESKNDEKEHKPIPELKPIERSGSSNTCMKGFVPYEKRTAERDDKSTLLTDELREEQRIRLTL